MNILVTGASGLLGRYLLQTAPTPYAVIGTYWKYRFTSKRHMDAWMSLTSQMDVDSLLHSIQPEVVIHCAGLGDVDECEKDPRKSRIINVLGTEHLAKRAMYYGCQKFVFLSTNAVFDGGCPPYSEANKRFPVNEYGRQKVEAEDKVLDICGNKALIVRPILLYGWHRSTGRGNWATRIYGWLSQGKTARVVNDRITQPTYVGDVASAIWQLVDRNAAGIYHVGGLEMSTLFSFACVVADVFGLDKDLIQPASSDEFPTLAPRPINTTYCMDRLYASGVIPPGGIKDGLVRMRDERIYQTT